MPRRTDVRDTYDRIAAHFSVTRPEPWPEVEAFLDGKHGPVGLDVGVGNGRHAELLASRVGTVIGLDVSRVIITEALDRARTRGYLFSPGLADAAALPIRDGSIDLAVYVATLHHLPTRPLRIQSLDELARVLSGNGAAIVSAWSTTHERFDRETGFDTEVDWTLPDGERVPRYYHIYDPAEFRADVEESALDVEDVFVSAGNCFAVVANVG